MEEHTHSGATFTELTGLSGSTAARMYPSFRFNGAVWGKKRDKILKNQNKKPSFPLAIPCQKFLCFV